MSENLIKRDQWYRYYKHYVERDDVVQETYTTEGENQVLHLQGFSDEIKITLSNNKKQRSDQYCMLCDWISGQVKNRNDSLKSKEISAAESYAASIDIDMQKEPEELLKSMMNAMQQIADNHEIDLDNILQDRGIDLN